MEYAPAILKEIRREIGPQGGATASGEARRRPLEKPTSLKPQKKRIAPLQGTKAPAPRPAAPNGSRAPVAPSKPATTRIHLGATDDWKRDRTAIRRKKSGG
jgi:hypothetical protein